MISARVCAAFSRGVEVGDFRRLWPVQSTQLIEVAWRPSAFAVFQYTTAVYWCGSPGRLRDPLRACAVLLRGGVTGSDLVWPASPVRCRQHTAAVAGQQTPVAVCMGVGRVRPCRVRV